MSSKNEQAVDLSPEARLNRVRDEFEAFRLASIDLISCFVWNQWSQMGFAPEDGGCVPCLDTRAADPESLLLTSLEVARDDRHLRAAVLDWLAFNHHRLNRQRLVNLCVDSADSELVAALSPNGASPGRAVAPDLLASINFAFRMRSIFGKTVRAEMLRVLLGTFPNPLSVRELVEHTAFSKRNVLRAIAQLQQAGLVTDDPGSRILRITVEGRSWLPLLADPRGVLPDFMHWTEYLRACRVALRWLRSDSCTHPGTGYRFQLDCDDLLFRVHRGFIMEAGTPPTWSGSRYVYMEEMTNYLQLALGPLEIYG